MVVAGSTLGLNGATPPSEKITMAVFGWGMQGPGNTHAFLHQKDVQVVAACNVDSRHLDRALEAINKHYGNSDAKGYKDYREVMARKDIDAVMLALPDHWHAHVSLEAIRNGKDVYGEKPLAKTLHEQQLMVKAVEEHKRIFQIGSQQRSSDEFHKACEIVRNGLIGKITAVEVGLPGAPHDFAGTKDKTAITEPPKELDYDFWTGPSQLLPYIEARTHLNWRWNYNTGGGQLLDWIQHHGDIAFWGMDWDRTGPVEIKPIQWEFPAPHEVWNVVRRYRVELTFPDGIVMTVAGGHDDIRSGTKFIGTDGWVWVNRGQFESSNPEFRKFSRLPENLRTKVTLFKSPGHHRNFIDCVKSREKPICSIEIGHRSASAGHLADIALKVGRTIKWDPEKEEIIGDSEAAALLTREYRDGWKLV